MTFGCAGSSPVQGTINSFFKASSASSKKWLTNKDSELKLIYNVLIMMNKFLIFFFSLNILTQCQSQTITKMDDFKPRIQKSDSEWLEKLGPERFRILRQKGTEYPGSGEYDKNFKKGTYSCAGCGNKLFTSESKFDAHCGWPSFDKEIIPGAITEVRDFSAGMIRTEILCTQCGGHLGHVFNDGPTETKLRYCVNSLSMSFEEK